MLRDLPGFDFSRRAGASYSNIYQRGYRSIETTRTMLLVDGVEDNDLASSTAWISRQFPLSNVERIEVVYGPASTMYGANAFAGVINVITKDPEQIVQRRQAAGARTRGPAPRRTPGCSTRPSPARPGTGASRWSAHGPEVEGRRTSTHLEDDPNWDYDPAFYDGVDYAKLSSLNATTPAAAPAILSKYTPRAARPLLRRHVRRAGQAGLGQPDAGGGRPGAAGFDKTFYGNVVGGYDSPVDDWMVSGKLHDRRTSSSASRPTARWSRRGSPSSTPSRPRAGTASSGRRSTRRSSRSTRSATSTASSRGAFRPVQAARARRDRLGRRLPRELPAREPRIEDLLLAKSPFLSATYKYRSNDQLRDRGQRSSTSHSEKLNVVGGVELRYSSIGRRTSHCPRRPRPRRRARCRPASAGGNQIASRDVGAFVQASCRPVKPLKLVAGVRFDNNKIRDTGGYGTVFNPRLAAVYTWNDFMFKAIYAEAFQDAPNFQKYEKPGERLLNNPTLAPEKVTNFELSAGWSPGKDLTVQLVGYRATYEGIVEEVFGLPCPAGATCPTGTTSQFQNVGALEILGAQLEGQWSPGRYRFVGTYTYEDPEDTVRDLRVGDIADHRFGLSGTARLFADRIDANLRLNAAVGRKTGKGTTVTASPLTKIDDYLIAGGAVTYRSLFVPGLDLQLSVENLLGSTWYEPSLRNPSGFPIAAQVPQPGRTFFLRLRMTR